MSYDMDGLRVFLSGPMTGREGWNKPAFDAAEEWCREHGAKEVYNPATLVPKEGERVHPHERYMTRTLHELTKFGPTLEDVEDWFHPLYDVLVLLDGWWASDGASRERTVAMSCGIDVIELEEAMEWATDSATG